MPYIKSKTKPSKNSLPENREHITLFRNFDKLKIINEIILFREIQIQDKKKLQVLFPSSCRKTVLHLLHDEMGHNQQH
jgi:hypothetical protein